MRAGLKEAVGAWWLRTHEIAVRRRRWSSWPRQRSPVLCWPGAYSTRSARNPMLTSGGLLVPKSIGSLSTQWTRAEGQQSRRNAYYWKRLMPLSRDLECCGQGKAVRSMKRLVCSAFGANSRNPVRELRLGSPACPVHASGRVEGDLRGHGSRCDGEVASDCRRDDEVVPTGRP